MSEFGDYDDDILADQNIDTFGNLPDDNDEAELDKLIEKDKKEANKRKVKRAPRPKLTNLDLLGPKGYPALREMFDKWKPKHTNGLDNLGPMFELFKYWGHTLAPWMNFKDFMNRAVTLSHTRGVQTYMRKLKNGGPTALASDVDDDRDEPTGIVPEDDDFDDDWDDNLTTKPVKTDDKKNERSDDEEEYDLDEIFASIRQSSTNDDNVAKSKTDAVDDNQDDDDDAYWDDLPMPETGEKSRKNDVQSNDNPDETLTVKRKVVISDDEMDDVIADKASESLAGDDDVSNEAVDERRETVDSDDEEEKTVTKRKVVISDDEDMDDQNDENHKTQENVELDDDAVNLEESSPVKKRRRIVYSDDEDE